MKNQVQQLLKQILEEMGLSGVSPAVEISDDPSHGEYTTNIAMRLSKQLHKTPMVLAQEIVQKISNIDQKASPQIPAKGVLQDIDHVEVVIPGFINVFLSEAKLSSQISKVLKEEKIVKTGKKIMVEFAHPNTHKAFHIGHLRNITTGESIVRLLESQGITVIRANYQGDVGMHIAKALYALLQISELRTQIPKIKTQDLHAKVEFLGKAYAQGSKAFEESDEVKKEIGEINKQIYARDPTIMALYEETRKWSLDYFDAIYKRVGTHFDRLYFEGEVFEQGKKIVLEHVKKGIFEESKGAIIFPGEKFARLPSPGGEATGGQGLHNRVFVTGEGNATYEGKEMALARLQIDEYHPDQIIHVVGPEQAGYFQVLFKALEQVFPDTAGKEFHLIYGWVKLKHGKMSSRSGDVVLGEWLLDEAKKEIYNILQKNRSDYSESEQNDIAERGAIAAVKYAFLKVSTKQEIAFDLKESVSFEGDSGPYLLYTYARAKSVLRKSSSTSDVEQIRHIGNPEERSLARLIHFFPEIVEQAAHEYAPNMICRYLFELAQAFNLFYQKHAIIGNNARLALTDATAHILKNGLYLLGIETVERM